MHLGKVYKSRAGVGGLGVSLQPGSPGTRTARLQVSLTGNNCGSQSPAGGRSPWIPRRAVSGLPPLTFIFCFCLERLGWGLLWSRSERLQGGVRRASRRCHPGGRARQRHPRAGDAEHPACFGNPAARLVEFECGARRRLPEFSLDDCQGDATASYSWGRGDLGLRSRVKVTP